MIGLHCSEDRRKKIKKAVPSQEAVVAGTWFFHQPDHIQTCFETSKDHVNSTFDKLRFSIKGCYDITALLLFFSRAINHQVGSLHVKYISYHNDMNAQTQINQWQKILLIMRETSATLRLIFMYVYALASLSYLWVHN